MLGLSGVYQHTGGDRMLQDNLTGVKWEPGFNRPFFVTNPNSPLRGQACVTVNQGRYKFNNQTGEYVPDWKTIAIRALQERGINSPVFNATSMRKEQWLEFDKVLLRAARLRMRAWTDLANSNTYGLNGMAKSILEHETMNDPGEAIVDMDGLTPGRNDGPRFQLEGLPLPITHCDFFYGARRMAESENMGAQYSIDAVMGEAAARRVGESVEKQLIGVDPGITYGGQSTQYGGYGRASKVFGYLTFPNRLTFTTLHDPSAGGWTPNLTMADVNACLQQLRLNKFYGPFMVYTSNDWDPYLDGDYYVLTTSGGLAPTKTLRTRLKEIDGVQDIRRLDFLASDLRYATDPARITQANPFTMIFVQMTSDVARAVNGLDITTIQWQTVGGLKTNFKVMTISVPQLRADNYGHCGLLVATTH